MKFRILLLFIYVRLVWLSRKDVRFKEKIADKSVVLVFGAADKSIYRHYRFDAGKIESRRGLPEKYDLSLEFSSAAYGYRLLTQKAHDPMSFARGMNKRDIILRGRMDEIFWLMGLGKHMPLKRRKSRSRPSSGRAPTAARVALTPSRS